MSQADPRVLDAIRWLVEFRVLEIVLLLASVAVLALLLERIWSQLIWGGSLPLALSKFVQRASQLPHLDEANAEELLRVCRANSSRFATVVAGLVRIRGASLSALLGVARDSLQHEYETAARPTNHLAWLGQNTPLLGLLGTVLGLMLSFGQIGVDTSNAQTLLSQGISTALVATAGGIVIALVARGAAHVSRQSLRAGFGRMQSLVLSLVPALAGDSR